MDILDLRNHLNLFVCVLFVFVFSPICTTVIAIGALLDQITYLNLFLLSNIRSILSSSTSF